MRGQSAPVAGAVYLLLCAALLLLAAAASDWRERRARRRVLGAPAQRRGLAGRAGERR